MRKSAKLIDFSVVYQQMYSFGARKVIVSAVGPIGCIPYQLARYNGNSSWCNEKINNAIILFNSGLRELVDTINNGQMLPGAKFVYLDSYTSSIDLYQNAAASGNLHAHCCKPNNAKFVYLDPYKISRELYQNAAETYINYMQGLKWLIRVAVE